MSIAEIKTEIHKLVEEVPEHILLDALNVLKKHSDDSAHQAKRATHIDLILKEDKELLNRLAQ